MRIVLICLLLLVTLGKDCEGDIYRGKHSGKSQGNTPKGAIVSGADSVPDSMKVKMDEGLDNLFSIAEAPPYNYTGFNRHPAYRIWMYKRSDRCENPGFLVDADSSPGWDQTEWDKDPERGQVLLCAAGLMIRRGAGGTSVGLPGMLVVQDLGIMSNIVRFEGEHNVLLESDPVRYNETFGVHAHPLLPDATGNLEETGNRKDAATATLTRDIPEFGLTAGTEFCVLLTK